MKVYLSVDMEGIAGRGTPYARAANERRCCGHGPWTSTARVWSGVM